MKLVALASFVALAACTSSTSSPDAAPAHGCTGTPTSCYALATSATCYAELGCLPSGGTCDGVAAACSSYFDEFSCDRESGCSWDSLINDCTGYRSCSLKFDATSCATLSGCTWTPFECGGTPTKCSLFEDEMMCGKQAGCSWK
jgi:hypothetical protein